jgi:hypothetical protein
MGLTEKKYLNKPNTFQIKNSKTYDDIVDYLYNEGQQMFEYFAGNK